MPEALLVVLVLVLIALAVVAIVLVLRTKQRQAQPKATAPADPFHSADTDAVRGDPRKLAPGALVEIRGTSYAVRGSLHMAEGAWTWDEHLLETAEGHNAWLSVEEDPELELVLFTDVPGESVSADKTIELAGTIYRLTDSGTARFTGQGTTGLNPSGTVKYRDYEGDGKARLALEDFGTGTWTVSVGEVLSRYEVRVYPDTSAGEDQ
ncbi:DUF4178 domain-containing protein [Haloechinothrix halophila]|uniref:DUF4178 domain-containing protein n=1 Tax=Haloechinothrix halophila TaxID=1069073 RepID=UPI00040F0232|nr:DUF4178 domain-containing protein [Haloechinothrix halophila]